MAKKLEKTPADSWYEGFLREQGEQNGNFYFLRTVAPELYQKVLDVEGRAIVDTAGAGATLRVILEDFQKVAAPGNIWAGKLAEISDKSGTPDIYAYERLFRMRPELGVDGALFGTVRKCTNPFHHIPEPEKKYKEPRNRASLYKALEAFHAMLWQYYQKTQPNKMPKRECPPYDKDRMPINRYFVCSVLGRLDTTNCERQLLCYTRTEDGGKMYGLIRQYSAAQMSEDTLRDEKVLSQLWNNNENTPNRIVKYRRMDVSRDEYGVSPALDDKYLLMYEFGVFKPCPLNTEIIQGLSQEQKIIILHDMAVGVREMHMKNLYHRNLQPNAVFVYFTAQEERVRARLVGFECGKIVGAAATVLARVVQVHNNPTAFCSEGMKAALNNPQIAARLDWAAEDVYSLGALFYYVLENKEPPRMVKPADFSPQTDRELQNLVLQMMQPLAAKRPTARQVCGGVLGDYYDMLMEE